MKDLVNKLISNLHIFILLYGLWGTYTQYDTHSIALGEAVALSASIDSEILEFQKKIKEIEEFVKKSDEYKVRVEEVAKNIESVQRQLPAETNDTGILTYFQDEISGLNIKDGNFSPGKEEKSTYYISREYSLKATGTYLQFLIFFERLGSADRIYNVKNLKFSTFGENQKSRFQMIQAEGIIQAFRYNPEFKVDRGF